MTERVAWFQCAAGTAGDMTLGALVAAGADPADVAAALQGLGIDGWTLTFERTQRCGIAATHALVLVHGEHESPGHPHWDHQRAHDADQHREHEHDDRGRGHDDRAHDHDEGDHDHRHHGDDHGDHDHDHGKPDDRGQSDHDHDGHDHGDDHGDHDRGQGDHGRDRHGGHGRGHGDDGGRASSRDDVHGAHGDHGHGGGAHRPYRDIRALLEAADLPERVRERALRVFAALADVEGEMHGIDPEDVEFHEVGSLDAIVDVVGTCAALESLGVDRVECSPIGVGQGTVRAAHGQLPNPSPAVVALLARAQAPARGIVDHRELATPTGVALMTALAERFGPLPAMTVTAAGFGAGTLDIPGRPNVVQAVIGERPSAAAVAVAPDPGTASQLLEANLDDATGEVLAHAVTALLAAGAQDAWVTPIVMKKGRPAHTVHALCDPARAADVAAVLVAETGTLGLRASTVQRWPQRREERDVELDGQRIRVKVTGGRVKVEHDDAARAAAALDLPLRTVLARAEAAVEQPS